MLDKKYNAAEKEQKWIDYWKDNKIYVLEVNPIMGIFLEEGMRAGSKMPIQKDIPNRFKTDNKKIELIIEYIDNFFESKGDCQ